MTAAHCHTSDHSVTSPLSVPPSHVPPNRRNSDSTHTSSLCPSVPSTHLNQPALGPPHYPIVSDGLLLQQRTPRNHGLGYLLGCHRPRPLLLDPPRVEIASHPKPATREIASTIESHTQTSVPSTSGHTPQLSFKPRNSDRSQRPVCHQRATWNCEQLLKSRMMWFTSAPS
jgi:hypothetical protein